MNETAGDNMKPLNKPEVVLKYENMLREDSSLYFEVSTINEIYSWYIQNQKSEKATELIDFALEQHPSQGVLYFKKAELLFDADDFKGALENIDSAISFNPSSEEFFFLKADILISMNLFPAAEAVLLERVLLNPFPETIYFQLGMCALNASVLDKAEMYFEKALEGDESFEEAMDQLLFSMELNGKEDQIPAFLDTFIDEYPFSHYAWYNLAEFYFSKDNIEKAIECIDFAIAINDEFQDGFFLKGQMLSDNGKYDEAIKAFLDALVLDPEDLMCKMEIGDCYFKTKNYKAAARSYLKVLNSTVSFPEIYMKLGNCMEMEERFLEAIHYFRRESRVNKTNEKPFFALARAELKLGNIISAYENLKKAFAINTNDISMWMEWAQLLNEDGNIHGAIEFLKEAVRIHSGSSELYFQLSAYQISLGNISIGINLLENALIMDSSKINVFKRYFLDYEDLPFISELINQYEKE